MHFIISDDCGSHPPVVGASDSRATVTGLGKREIPNLRISWNTFGEHDENKVSRQDSVIHLGDLLHDKEAVLQRVLYDWLSELARRYTAIGSPLPKVFENLHSWWLLSLSEKNYATTPEFTTLMKFMLLSKLCDEHSPTSIDYNGNDRQLESAIREFADAKGYQTNARRPSFMKRLRLKSEPLQAAVHFVRVMRPALLNSLRQTNVGSPEFSLVGYLIPASGELSAQSPYWGNLPNSLTNRGQLLWLYHRSDEMPHRIARRYCRVKNSTSTNEVHRVIDDFITIGALGRSLKTYFSWRLARRELRLNSAEIPNAYRTLPVDTLFASQLRDSLSGSRAISTIIQSHVYDRLVRKLPSTNWLFLWENKPFEHALVSAVSRHSHKSSIGYAHSVIRRLDHRYFDETHGSGLDNARRRPTPTMYAVNSPVAHEHLRRLGPPNTRVVEVEALRYAPLQVAERVRPSRLLVLGDISRTESERLLTLTVSAVERSPASLELWFKPHPGSPSHSEMALRLGFSVTFDHLAELAPDLLLAIVGVAGAASVDLTLLAVPVITMLDARTPNLSPLAGISGANFARSASQLSEFIKTPQLHQISADSLAYRSVGPIRWLELVNTIK